jgi:hypothetical protein
MAIDVAKITKSREIERAKISGSATSQDPVIALELRYIADSLEAIRGELALLGTLAGTMASKPGR